MRTKTSTIFALSGGMAGVFLLVLAKAIPLLLLFGVGPCIVGASVLAALAQDIPIRPIRSAVAVLLSIPAYLLAFGGFAETASLMQRHGAAASSVLSDMRPDVLLGLVVAVVIASVLLEALTILISGRWSALALGGMLAGGLVSVACSYTAKVIYFHTAGPPEGSTQIAILFGPLFIIGGGMTAMVLGGQMKLASQAPGRFGEIRDRSSLKRH